jgi:aspartate aminotransferase
MTILNSPLSKRVNLIQPSATLAIDAKVKKMQADGGDIINLGVGEPDFDTPQFIKQAAIEAIESGFTKYTPVGGIDALKQAICDKYSRENHLKFELKNIIVSNGAKQSIFNLMQAMINPEDEVIIPAPYWVSYPDMTTLCEGKPVFLETSFNNQFKINAEQLEQAITNKTKLFILNSPSNPTGMCYTREELSELAKVLLKFPHVYILSDDIYEHIVWNTSLYSNILNVCPELMPRTILVNGVSKAYAMTGWRIGYAAANPEIVNAMTKIQSQSTSNPNSIAQKATIAALNGNQQCIADMVKAFKTRHDFVFEALQDIEGIQCQPNQGTFYIFADCHELIEHHKSFNNDVELADYLLTHSGVGVVPGSAFGAPNCIRLSYATALETLTDAMSRIKTVLKY